MRIVPIMTALIVVFVVYMVTLERQVLIDFAGGDRSALGRIALVASVNGAGAESVASDAEAAPVPATADLPEATQPAGAEAARQVSVVAQRSASREIDRGVILRGRTEAARQVQVRAETSGRVISEPMRRGEFVDEGQILCDLAPGTRLAGLAEAEARLAEARIQFTAAERLSQEGFASETRAVGARAALQGAEAAVAASREELSRLQIRAPFAGLLESDAAEFGSLLQPGALCATVIQLDPIRLVGFVPETDVDKIEVGAPAGARLTSGRILQGQVSFVSRAADPATRTFRVDVTVANPDWSIRDGQTAEIGIAASGAPAHLVPGSALTLDDDGRIGLRTVDQDSRALFRAVEVVRDSVDGIWVTGLPDAVDIIVVGQEFVRDGVQLAVTYREPPSTGRRHDVRNGLVPETGKADAEVRQ